MLPAACTPTRPPAINALSPLLSRPATVTAPLAWLLAMLLDPAKPMSPPAMLATPPCTLPLADTPL